MEDLEFEFTFPEDFDFQLFAVKGDKGDKGDTGDTGPTGPQGEQGIAGQDGRDGADAKINGVNTITIVAGTNIGLNQNGNVLTINNTYTDDESTKANKTEAGNNLLVSIDNTTYVMTLKLRDIYNNIISTQTVDLPLETMVVNGSYDSVSKKIILTLQNGNTIEFSVADLVSGLQSEITSSNKLSSDLVDDTNSTNKFTNSTEKSTWNSKYNKPTNGIPKTDLESIVQTSLGKADISISQFSTMPTATSELVGKVYQYIGTTDNTYKNGYFYKCVEDNGTYSWENINVQESSGGNSIEYLGMANDFNYDKPLSLNNLKEGYYILGSSYQESVSMFFKAIYKNVELTKGFNTSSIVQYKISPFIILQIVEPLSDNLPSNTLIGYICVCGTFGGELWYVRKKIIIKDNNLDISSSEYASIEFITKSTAQNITAKKTFTVLPESSVVPTTNNQLVNKKYVDDLLKSYTDYDATKTQVLKNINGTFTWIDEA